MAGDCKPQLVRARNRVLPLVVFSALISILPTVTEANTWVAFGPATYTRGSGAPVSVTDTFTLLNPATQYTLKAFNGGLQDDTTELVSSCAVLVNGVQVIGPGNFDKNVSELDVPVTLLASNTISVQVKGKPGGTLTIEIIGVDNDPPTITASLNPPPNAAGWNNSPVTVTFTCSDKTSGVASCPAPTTVGTEGANQTISGTATDLAGNTATTSVTVNLDMTPPVITATVNPPPDASSYNSSAVTVTFTCTDALSGVASCSPPVALATEGTFPETGTATDVAGNTAATTVTVNISFKYFKIQSWQTGPNGNVKSPSGKCLDYGASPSGNGASVFLNDCANAHSIRVVEISPERTGNGIDPATGQPIVLHHEVLLFAGEGVIGVYIPSVISQGGTAPAPQPVTEYQLEIQPPFFSPRGAALFSPAQQIWRLDGDSIILEGSSLDPQTGLTLPGPCISTWVTIPPFCADQPPQLVVQIQNARGANGSPLVAAVRNLADNEFWDFVPLPGSQPYPTTGFISMVASSPISTSYQLWNAICASPQATAAGPTVYSDPNSLATYGQPVPCNMFNPGFGWGSVVVVAGDDPNECNSRPDVGPCLDFSMYPPIQLPAGVTVRGNRRGIEFGPQLFASYDAQHEQYQCDRNCILQVAGDYVRVTGFRVRGQSRSTDTLPFKTDGVWIEYVGRETSPGGAPPQIPLFPLATVTELIATIDHNDMSDWMDSAITVNSPFSDSAAKSNKCTYQGYVDPSASPQGFYTCDNNTQTVPYSPALVSLNPNLTPVTIVNDPGTLANVRVSRNFLHHNERNEGGYGVAMGNSGGRLLIDGNVFSWNRHDITAAGEPHSQYRASHNLVLSSAYDRYGFLGVNGRLQDFDMHGTDNVDNTFGSLYFGGAGGYYVEIDGNTFLGSDGHDYVLRGYPALNSFYHHNVSRRKENDAIHFIHCALVIGCINDYNASDFPINIFSDNQFADSNPSYTDPATRFGPASLGVGDFDGDGDDDLFMATGVAWYYSPAGKRDWRYLNSAPDTTDQLLLGDFDGDGRTDVVALRNGQLVVSWGGISAFDVLNYGPLPCTSISSMAVGDFDGDGHPDIFCADGQTWWVSFGGNTAFQPIQTSSFLVANLGFGDFNGDGTTDVLGVVSLNGSNYYQVSYSPKGTPGALFSSWTPLQAALTNSVAGFMVADFNGDGVADIFVPSSDGWQISYSGTQPWTDVAQGSLAFLAVAGVGHFTGQPQADILQWNGLSPLLTISGTGLLLSAAGVSPATPYSTQDMR